MLCYYYSDMAIGIAGISDTPKRMKNIPAVKEKN
jgi:hypothetical protein